MKKIVILFVMMFAVALWFSSTASAANPSSDGTAPNDEVCTDGACGVGTWTDIDDIEVFSDGTNIIVEVVMCADVDAGGQDVKTMIKYRIHIDHRLPEPLGTEDEQPYGDSHGFIADADCKNSDTGVMYRFHMKRHKSNTGQNPLKFGKVYGPGDVVVEGDELTFTIPYDGLRNALGQDPVGPGNTVHIWMDTQNSQHEEGICDRAPNTDDDGCDGGSMPNETTEVLTISLDSP